MLQARQGLGATLEAVAGQIAAAAEAIVASLESGGKLLACGNGGSASQAEHLAAELVGRFLRDRDSLPAIALTTNSSTVTSIANDYSFADVFARQVEGHARPGDSLVALSTSGESENVARACRAARSREVTVIAITGRGGGAVGKEADVVIAVDETKTPLIQEMHLIAIHMICDIVESALFAPSPKTPDTEASR